MRSFVLLVPLLLLVAPRFVFHGGILHFEARKFLLHFTRDRSFLAKVFDPDENDLGDHRGRELSSVVDFGDAQWVDASIRAGRPSFLPISWLVGSTAIVCLVLAKTRKLFPRVGVVTTCTLLGLFLSDPVVFLDARTYIRSAKMDAAVVLLLLTYFAWEWVGQERAGGRRDLLKLAAGGFGFSLAISCMDEQGAFLGGVVALVAFVACALERRDERSRLVRAATFLVAVGAGVVLSRALYHWVTPSIIHALNGYWPNHDYETGVDSDPLTLGTVSLAVGWLADQASYALGTTALRGVGGAFPLPGAPGDARTDRVAALAILVAGTWVVSRFQGARGRRPVSVSVSVSVSASVIVSALVATGCFVVMATLMIQRHSAVAQADVRLGYYGLPLLVLGLFAATLAVDRAALLLGRRRVFLDAALFAGVLCNVAALPNHERVSVSNHMRLAAMDTPILIEMLKSRRFAPPDPRLPRSGIPGIDRQTDRFLAHYAAVLGDPAAVTSSVDRSGGASLPPR